MGLDIVAYRQLTEEPNADPDSGVSFYRNPDFPNQFDGLKGDVSYTFSENYRFYAGGYGGYNRWRDALAELAGYPLGTYIEYDRPRQSHCVACWNGQKGPFAELIYFSDCEGSIGSVVSAKLAADFAAFQEKADAHAEPDFRNKYAEWRKAFDMAADGGAVDFR